jgi:hypothetical protein
MRLRTLGPLALFLCAPLAAIAQDSVATRAPDRNMREHVPGIEVLPVPGLPFSGHDSIDWTRKLEDGTTVTPLLAFSIYDRDAGTRTTCKVLARTCSVSGYKPSLNFREPPAGPSPNGKFVVARESLGSNVIENLNVVGTRETITFPAGAVGNNPPTVSSREFWYSPDLQINLSITRKLPLEGTQSIQLRDLSRSEPDAALFQVPSGYQVEDHRSTSVPSVGGR